MSMSNHQLRPLEINSTTKEPFLRLRKHTNIILTPPRLNDAESYLWPMNDPLVHEKLAGPPFPYTLDDSVKWLEGTKAATDRVLQELEDAGEDAELKIVGECPVRTIRQVMEDGTDMLIGDLGLMRCRHGELMNFGTVDWENKEKLQNENDTIEVGNPNIIWSMGDFVVSSHHGQGIMSDAVDTVMHEWAIPRMNVRHMWVSAYTDNPGSVKVFLKNGFKIKGTYENLLEAKGKMRGLHLLEWSVIDFVDH
ncbi:hypothetical protein B0H34DRAFT_18902 [Crassisporium funariophilum]|nr:hypothetical protein B0H34DRAFT_18902 [Crassisporium funariophilum]